MVSVGWSVWCETKKLCDKIPMITGKDCNPELFLPGEMELVRRIEVQSCLPNLQERYLHTTYRMGERSVYV